jgi:hypothetical protein
MRIAPFALLLFSCADRPLDFGASSGSPSPVGGAVASFDFGAAARDFGGSPDLATGCPALNERDCVLSDHCHATYKDSGLCDCSGLCCPIFDRCWDRKHANCGGPGCGADPPACLPLSVAYGGGCYEGCVKSEECAGTCQRDDDCGPGQKCCPPGPPGPIQCSVAPGGRCPPLS